MFYWLGIAFLLTCPKVAQLNHAEYDQQTEYDPELSMLVMQDDNDIYSDENNKDDVREYNEYMSEFNKNLMKKKAIIRNSGKHQYLTEVKTKHKKDFIGRNSPKFKRRVTPRKTTAPSYSNLKNLDHFEEAKLVIDNKSTEPELHNHLIVPNAYQLVTRTSELNEKNKVHQSDNIAIASVTEDNNVSKEEELVQSVNPQDVFLEPSIINKTDKNRTRPHSSPAYHIHVVEVTNENTFLHKLNSSSFIVLIVCCCVAGVAAIVLTGYCWFKFGNDSGTKVASGSDYKKVKKENYNQLKKTPGDETLAENAKMFHYIHQKKQMQQLSKNSSENQDNSANNTDDEDDENTVYECPGLAPPGDMKVVNPMFSDSENYPSSKCGSNPESPPPPYADLPMETPTNN
ncbi:uncharacterized protein LOC100199534 [Hydra vulgaris]|uniref:Uncharacterized protein LOC100199534 n=1 Tax=Hydra vulgaris TaxID=6087 RepID=A0ABM4BEQ1_HYDVU